MRAKLVKESLNEGFESNDINHKFIKSPGGIYLLKINKTVSSNAANYTDYELYDKGTNKLISKASSMHSYNENDPKYHDENVFRNYKQFLKANRISLNDTDIEITVEK